MKALVVRVNKASVAVKGKIISSIGKGLAVFAGIEKGDSKQILSETAKKIVNLRVFENEQAKMHYSLKDKGYSILCISNFTLCANTEKGRRPSFEQADAPDKANKLFEDFVSALKSEGAEVKTGAFGKHMDIQADMDGPVNIVL